MFTIYLIEILTTICCMLFLGICVAGIFLICYVYDGYDDFEKYKDKLKKVEEIIKMKEISNYEVMESNYRKFIEVNGTKQIKCPMGIELRNNNARYFLINKNNEFYNDFVIYNNNNWLTLDKRFILDEKLMEHIFNYLKDEGYDYITIYVPVEDEKFMDYLKTHYDITLEKLKQNEYEYYQVKLLLK